ncbi:uncharacterized protein LOC135561306 [Oncorhynchus nerka]|uniref:uncharacterized protein LOC135561306 n=1 Tax=Oncorhynchus nerka TaxID=8023 RepID=UPI0031B81512
MYIIPAPSWPPEKNKPYAAGEDTCTRLGETDQSRRGHLYQTGRDRPEQERAPVPDWERQTRAGEDTCTRLGETDQSRRGHLYQTGRDRPEQERTPVPDWERQTRAGEDTCTRLGETDQSRRGHLYQTGRERPEQERTPVPDQSRRGHLYQTGRDRPEQERTPVPDWERQTRAGEDTCTRLGETDQSRRGHLYQTGRDRPEQERTPVPDWERQTRAGEDTCTRLGETDQSRRGAVQQVTGYVRVSRDESFLGSGHRAELGQHHTFCTTETTGPVKSWDTPDTPHRQSGPYGFTALCWRLVHTAVPFRSIGFYCPLLETGAHCSPFQVHRVLLPPAGDWCTLQSLSGP